MDEGRFLTGEASSIAKWIEASRAREPCSGRVFCELTNQESKKWARLRHAAVTLSLPIYEQQTFRLPFETNRLICACRRSSAEGLEISLRLETEASRELIYRDVRLDISTLPSILLKHTQNGIFVATISPYIEPAISGTLLVQQSHAYLELVKGPHYWLTKAIPHRNCADLLHCRYTPPLLSVKYSTKDPLARACLYRHFSRTVRLTLGFSLRDLRVEEMSVYAEFHWTKRMGYRFLEWSQSSAWTVGRANQEVQE
jgi:hypothetical protein